MWRSAVQLRAGLRYGGIAQLVEHLLCKQGVKSSNLFISTQKDSFLWKLSFFVISALPSALTLRHSSCSQPPCLHRTQWYIFVNKARFHAPRSRPTRPNTATSNPLVNIISQDKLPPLSSHPYKYERRRLIITVILSPSSLSME